MTAELSQAMQDRDYHLKKAQKTKSAHHWSSYRKLRCLVNRKVRECKSNYYETLIKENNNNPSGLWKTLNELTSRGTHSSSPASVIPEGVEHKTSKTIASLFNNFFTNVGISLANAIKKKNVFQKHSTQTNHHKLTPPLNSRRLKSCLSKSNYLLLKLTSLLASIVSAPGL